MGRVLSFGLDRRQHFSFSSAQRNSRLQDADGVVQSFFYAVCIWLGKNRTGRARRTLIFYKPLEPNARAGGRKGAKTKLEKKKWLLNMLPL